MDRKLAPQDRCLASIGKLRNAKQLPLVRLYLTALTDTKSLYRCRREERDLLSPVRTPNSRQLLSFLPGRIFYPYEMDDSICKLMGSGLFILSFLFHLKEIYHSSYANSEPLIRHRVLRRLTLVCTIFQCPIYGMLRSV